MAETAESVLGISEAVLKAYPELQSVYDLFKAGNLTAAAEALQKTNYYRNISPTVRSRANAKLTWFGRALKKHNPFINLDGADVMLLPCYSGDVVAGLGLNH